MASKEPVAQLDPRFSSNDATPVPWAEAQEQLEMAEVYWLSTVRLDGRPHVRPKIAVWHDGALHVCTGPGERKAKNLGVNAHCVMTTGCNTFSKGRDLVVEGDAVRVSDDTKLQRLADLFESKFGRD